MTLEIEGLREAVLSESVYAILLELMKFRHFRRYYFEFEYDWDKLGYLEKKYQQVKPLVTADLQRFDGFLKSVLKAG